MADSIFMRAMEQIETRIRALHLDGIDTDRIKVRRHVTDGEHLYPGISIHPIKELYHTGTNERENVGYGCAVTMVVNNNNDEFYKLDQLLHWREEIRRNFVEDARLTGVDNTCTVKVDHGYPLDWDELVKRNQDVSSLVLRVYVLETRT